MKIKFVKFNTNSSFNIKNLTKCRIKIFLVAIIKFLVIHVDLYVFEVRYVVRSSCM